VTTELTLHSPYEHQAVKAWSELRPQLRAPEAIHCLKASPMRKSLVYRLDGVGPGGSAVVAKRCRRVTAVTERIIYQEILPNLPIPSVRYYGYVEEPAGDYCWLFIEHADGEEYSPLIEEHRVLVARWLAAIHTSAECIAVEAGLPDRGPRYYLEHLRAARNTIVEHRGNPALGAGELDTLQAILARCDVLESRWSEIAVFCEGLPRTLVHGDLVGKNLRVRGDLGGIAIVAFDWEEAGWGVPAIDLANSSAPTNFLVNPDLATYWSSVRDHWPSLGRAALNRLANQGRAFRCLAAISWEARSLAFQWVKWPVANMAAYDAEMAQAIRASGWED